MLFDWLTEPSEVGYLGDWFAPRLSLSAIRLARDRAHKLFSILYALILSLRFAQEKFLPACTIISHRYNDSERVIQCGIRSLYEQSVSPWKFSELKTLSWRKKTILT